MSDSFESDSSRSNSKRSSRSSSTSSASPAGSPMRPTPVAIPSQPQQYQPVPQGDVSASYAQQQPQYPVQVLYNPPAGAQARHNATSQGSSDSEDFGRPSAHGGGTETVRFIKPDQFRALYNESIAPAVTFEQRGGNIPSSTVGMVESRPVSSGRPRPAAHHSATRPKDFIDPYRGTNYRNRINVPSDGTKAKGKEDAQFAKTSARLRQHLQRAQQLSSDTRSPAPPTQRNTTRSNGSGDIIAAFDQIAELKHKLSRREKDIDNLRVELRRMEEHCAKVESSALQQGGGRGSETTQIQSTIESLRGRSMHQEAKISSLEEELFVLKQSGRASRVGELQHQCAAYLAENRRLRAVMTDMTATAKAGGHAALLQEAQHLIRQKDSLIQSMSDSLRAAKDERRRADLEAETWRSKYEADHSSTDELRKRLDDLSKAPQEVLRLRRELELLQQEKLEHVHREERNHAGVASVQTANRLAMEQLTRERDQLLAHLKEKDRIAELQRTELSKRQEDVMHVTKAKANEELARERATAQDREFQLRQTIQEWERRFKELEELNTRLKESNRVEMEQQKAKEVERQQNMLATMGKYEKERTAEIQKSMEERERKLKQQMDQLEKERAEWESTKAHRLEEVERMKRQQQTVSVAAPAVSVKPQSTTVPQPPAMPIMSPSGPSQSQLREALAGGNTASSTNSSAALLSPGKGPNTAHPPVVALSQRLEQTTPTNGPKRSELSVAAPAAVPQRVARYDRGDDVQSEVTVQQARDDDSFSTTSSAHEREQAPSPPNQVITPPPAHIAAGKDPTTVFPRPVAVPAVVPAATTPVPVPVKVPAVVAVTPTAPVATPTAGGPVPAVVPMPFPQPVAQPSAVPSVPVAAVPTPSVVPPTVAVPPTVVPLPAAMPPVPSSLPLPSATAAPVGVVPIVAPISNTPPAAVAPPLSAVPPQYSAPIPAVVPVPSPAIVPVPVQPPVALPIPVPSQPAGAPSPSAPVVGAVAPTSKRPNRPSPIEKSSEYSDDSGEEFEVKENAKGGDSSDSSSSEDF